MAIKLNSTGGGSVTLDTPSTASNYTVTLPAATSTLIDTTSTQTLTNKTLVASGSNTVEATSGPTSTQLAGMRNKIINGAMMIDQRNAGASVTPNSGDYTLDRFQAFSAASSKYSVQQSTTSPAGFINSLKVTSLAATTVGSGDYYMIEHKIEGTNCSDLAWGTASAKTVTLSFQVYSSLTGTFGGAILNQASNRAYPFTYSISSSNTWTSISITVPGDTSGTWLTTTGTGLYISFSLGMGSTYSGTAGAWAGAQYWSATGATSVVGTNGATWYVTGVQLEKGATATPFENRLYGTELALCQRYYSKSFNLGTAPANNLGSPYTGTIFSVIGANSYAQGIYFPVSMRTSPTITFYNPLAATAGTWHVYSSGGGIADVTPTLNSAYISTAMIAPNLGGAYVLSYGDWTASAEL